MRANPAFELVLFDRLPVADRRRLAALAREPDHYGVLRPRPGSGLGLKAVDRDTALLVLTLAEPGPLPGYVHGGLGEGAAPAAAAALAAVARLVADGVLEIEGDGGEFVSGAAAMSVLVLPGVVAAASPLEPEIRVLPGAPGHGVAAGGGPAELSGAALRYAEELARTLPGIEAQVLSLRLYGYNRRPLTPAWRRLLPSPAAVRGYLGAAPGGACHALARRYWQEEPAGPAEGWLRWRSRSPAMVLGGGGGGGIGWGTEGERGGAAGRGGGGLAAAARRGGPAAAGGAARSAGMAVGRPTYKLYIGVPAEALPGSFAAILDGLAAAGAPGFKLGAGASGLLRPDKLVAYLPTFDGLAEAAAALGDRLGGIAPQGVPFSAEISGGGLLSWGMDPPPGVGTGALAERRTSWRLWLTKRLARALLAAVHAESAPGGAGAAAPLAAAPQVAAPPPGAAAAVLEPWRFAVERMRLEGVDPATWAPDGGLWRLPAEGG